MVIILRTLLRTRCRKDPPGRIQRTFGNLLERAADRNDARMVLKPRLDHGSAACCMSFSNCTARAKRLFNHSRFVIIFSGLEARYPGNSGKVEPAWIAFLLFPSADRCSRDAPLLRGLDSREAKHLADRFDALAERFFYWLCASICESMDATPH